MRALYAVTQLCNFTTQSLLYKTPTTEHDEAERIDM